MKRFLAFCTLLLLLQSAQASALTVRHEFDYSFGLLEVTQTTQSGQFIGGDDRLRFAVPGLADLISSDEFERATITRVSFDLRRRQSINTFVRGDLFFVPGRDFPNYYRSRGAGHAVGVSDVTLIGRRLIDGGQEIVSFGRRDSGLLRQSCSEQVTSETCRSFGSHRVVRFGDFASDRSGIGSFFLHGSTLSAFHGLSVNLDQGW